MEEEDVNDIVASPTATDVGNHSPRPDLNAANTVESSPPLPSRVRHAHSTSSARKRTNEEIYERVQPPLSTPSAPRTQRSFTATSTTDREAQHPMNDTIERPDRPALGEQIMNDMTTTKEARPISTEKANNSFAKEIEDYTQRLEGEFQDFERSLEGRDTALDLETTHWDDVEGRYNKEVQEHVIDEQEIMTEFGSRFTQFLLYMQVSNDHEAERAIKRLRTRIALAQNSEEALAQKQAHHAKVLEAFQSAMALLGNV